MERLNDYFMLKAIDQLEAEKKCLASLNKVMALCLKKNLHFSVNMTTNGISIRSYDFDFAYDSYFKGQLINYSDEHSTVTIHQLLEIIKKQK